MAIEIEWQVKPTDRGQEGIQPRIFPRIADSKVIDEQKLVEIMSKNSIHTRGTVTSILEDLSDTIATLLREGHTINIPSLGTFRLSIGSNSEITTATDPSARKAMVKGVKFLASKELKSSISTTSFRTVARNATPIAPPANSMVSVLSEFFNTHESITRTEFASIFNLKRATACRRLKELTDMGIIKCVGSNKDTRYVKAGRE